MNKRHIIITLFVVGCMALGAGAGLYTSGYHAGGQAAKPEIRGLLWPNPRALGDFRLTDHRGNPFTRDDLRGKWSLLFFGFTHCPDVCPTTLAKMERIYTSLKHENPAHELQVLFVSVDPDRDTPDALSQYVRYFNEEFIGLGNYDKQARGLREQMGIVSVRTEGSSPENYQVDHTASVFIVDPQARWVVILSAPHEVADMTERYIAIKKFISQQG
ncbi:MAG TPA: SCO family protein [Gammaproteobacteria bacterium]|nr:SCO family protein [Gammaproteobacteria bacterium]